jgi:hypothetical protein
MTIVASKRKVQIVKSSEVVTDTTDKRTRGHKKGQCTNPNGRPPKGTALTDILRMKLDKEKFVDLLIELAFKERDPAIIKYIYDRYEGKIPENVTFGDGSGGQMRYEITFRTVKEVSGRQDTETQDMD